MITEDLSMRYIVGRNNIQLNNTVPPFELTGIICSKTISLEFVNISPL